MNLFFEPLTEDATAVTRDAQPLAVMIRSRENRRQWGLFLDIGPEGEGVDQVASGTLAQMKRKAAERFCTCGECPKDRSA